MRHAVLGILCLFMLLSSNPLPIGAQAICPGTLPSRMRNGYPGEVVALNGINVRANPATSATLLGGLPQGAEFDVLDGPRCADGYAWWEIRSGTLVGWTAEASPNDYWLQTLAPVYLTVDLEDMRLLLDRAIASDVTARRTPMTDFGGVEMPGHLRFLLNDYPYTANAELRGDLAQISVFSIAAYNQKFNNRLDTLETLLINRPFNPQPPRGVPVVRNDYKRLIVTKPAYRDYQNGTGLRFLAYYSNKDTVVDRNQIYYVYLGISDDRQRFLQVFMPVLATALPAVDDVTLDGDFQTYLETVQATLDRAPLDSFSPSLSVLDRMINLVEIKLGTPRDTILVNYRGIRFVLEPEIATSALGETLPGVQLTLDSPAWAFPSEYVQVTLEGYPRLDDLPHLAVFPALDYNIQFVGTMDELTRAIQLYPVSPAIPRRLPITNKDRVLAVQPEMLNFDGGSGIRFLAYFSDTTAYITRYEWTYVFLGVNEGRQEFVQILLPLTATILPENAPADLDYDAFVETYDLHLDNVRRAVNNATPRSFVPRLDQLDALVESLRIN